MSGMTITIREARDEDAPAIAFLLHALMLDHDKEPPEGAQLTAAVAQVLAAPDAWYIVAETADQLIGMLQLNRRYSTWDHGHYGYIEDFFVAEEWRGRGVGARILRHVEATARARHWARLDLDMRAANEAARLYERAGFQQTDYVIYRRNFA